MITLGKENTAPIHVGSQHGGKERVTAGEIRKSNKCGEFLILNAIDSANVKVRFISTGFEGTFRAGNIRKGEVKDPMFPSVCGVGFVGAGRFKPTVNMKITKEYSIWQGMIRRCYDERALKRRPSYIGCTVCGEWHNFQNFAKWFNSECKLSCHDVNIDKDIKLPGNKVYSPDLCMVVPSVVNKFFISFESDRGEFLTGVTKRRGKFASACNDFESGKKLHLGYYSTEYEAHLGWRKKKSEMIDRLMITCGDDLVSNELAKWKKYLKCGYF